MTLGQQGPSDKAGRKKRARKSGSIPLAAHRAFAPLLGLWGAALGGLVVLVLPTEALTTNLAGTLIGTWGAGGQLLLAGTAAVLLGGSLLALGLHRHKRTRAKGHAFAVARAAMREVTPINPARDLGSRSLDDPLEAMPFSTPAWRDADLEVAPREAAVAPAPEAEPSDEPIELDLAAFAELPGRNAVWVEDVAASEPRPEEQPEVDSVLEPEAETPQTTGAPRLRAVTPPAPPAHPEPHVPGTAALNRLRAVALDDLSLAEMVERFAGALHEHRSAPRHAGLDPADLAAREAALAEALRALSALSNTVGLPATGASGNQPLVDALAQLQPRRGAA